MPTLKLDDNELQIVIEAIEQNVGARRSIIQGYRHQLVESNRRMYDNSLSAKDRNAYSKKIEHIAGQINK